jgi:uncharacterized protein
MNYPNPNQPYGMQCPRCRAPMRSYPRSGVQIERCDQCRGIFLDEGELETLTRNEAQWGPGGMPPPGYGGGYQGGYQGGYHDPNNQGGYAGPQYPGYGPYGGGAWNSGDPNNPAPPPDR